MRGQKKCFVIMPFSSTAMHTEKYWTRLFEDFIYPAMTLLDYDCIRSKSEPTELISNIISSLLEADLVVAVLTEKNPNVFYELGIRHALRKNTIMMIEEGQGIPFDLVSYGNLVYRYNDDNKDIVDFQEKAKEFISCISCDKIDSPVARVLGEEHCSGLKKVIPNGLKSICLPKKIVNSMDMANVLVVGIRSGLFSEDILKVLYNKKRKANILVCLDKDVSYMRAKSLFRDEEPYYRKNIEDYQPFWNKYGGKNKKIKFYKVFPFGLYFQTGNYSCFAPLWNFGLASSAAHHSVIEVETKSKFGLALIKNFYKLWFRGSDENIPSIM